MGKKETEMIKLGKVLDLFFSYPKKEEIAKTIARDVDIFKIMNSFSPKTTKVMHTSYFKDICTIEDTRLITLLAHLYIENFLNAIINKHLKYPSRILDYSFKSKLDMLNSSGIIDEQLWTDISFLNKTRNGFAHNIQFNINQFDFEKSPSLKKYYKLNPYKRGKLKQNFLKTIYRLWLFQLCLEMGNKFPEVYLLNI